MTPHYSPAAGAADSADRSAAAPTREQFAEVDDYLERALIRPAADFTRVQRAGEQAGMPQIEVSAAQGKLLHLLARISGAKRVLEVGTLAGYSTLWLAQAVGTDGLVISCEFEPLHAEVARKALNEAGVGERVEILLGAAEETLTRLIDEGAQPFDLIFLDADKARMDRYLQLGLELSRSGTVIVGDNVVRGGSVLTDTEDPADAGIRRFLTAQGNEPHLDATAVQTVGRKGWDGFSLAVVD